MNYKALAHEEAAFTLFAFKRALRDRDQLTPTMAQFYERSIEVLSSKVAACREEAAKQRSYADRIRDRDSEISSPWANH